ncbi:spore coat protein GerQ [Camelliibacillus cellulosilyticus]|uniref:Spore coat protein GerQ n=1 Tax=Camelliibacillus cellulosilyticus TaxID=2174486 RepID=A0ABV9GPJ7_9BACL
MPNQNPQQPSGWPYGTAPYQPQQGHAAYPITTGAAGPGYQPPQVGAQAVSPAQTAPPQGTQPLSAMQQSYIENILRMNREKVATVYMTFEHEGGAESKAFRGEIEAAGRDHVIINDNKTGTRYLLPLIYLDYVTFQGPINYFYPYG